MRVLGRLRISRSTEESTSIERQVEVIEQWASVQGHDIVGWAEDQDVSRSVDPFDTPGLGKWLTNPEKVAQWDIVATWKLDRLATGSIYLNKLMHWCFEHEKVIVSVTENFDLSTWVGRMIANVIAGVAEGELMAIKERSTASQKKLRELGRWAGGPAYYGYKPQPKDGAGWELAIDDHAHKILTEIIERTLAGQSTESIVIDLNKRGELSPADYIRKRSNKPLRGTKWATSTMRHQLRSKTLLGYVTHKGEIVYDDAGLPIQKGPALVDRDKFDQLQEVLKPAPNAGRRTTGASPLLGIVICDVCEDPMYLRQTTGKKGNLLRQYICKHGPYSTNGTQYNIIQADLLESHVEERFLYELGPQARTEKVYIPGEDHRAEMEVAERAVEDLTSLLGTVTSEGARARLRTQLTAAYDRLAKLEELPSTEARWERRETGETYEQAWNRMTPEERRQMMLKAGVQLRVQTKDRVPRSFAGVLHSNWIEPEDMKERLSS